MPVLFSGLEEGVRVGEQFINFTSLHGEVIWPFASLSALTRLGRAGR